MSRRTRARLAGGSTVVLLLLAGCGGSSSSSSTQPPTVKAPKPPSPAAPVSPTIHSTSTPGTVTASSGDLTATLHAGTRNPRVGHAWPIRFTVTRAGHPVAARVAYEYLFAGAVVAHRSHYTFTGRFSDVFRWPASAVGYPLTFRAVITSASASINLDYPVEVAR